MLRTDCRATGSGRLMSLPLARRTRKSWRAVGWGFGCGPSMREVEGGRLGLDNQPLDVKDAGEC